jgi:hypothetical protein
MKLSIYNHYTSNSVTQATVHFPSIFLNKTVGWFERSTLISGIKAPTSFLIEHTEYLKIRDNDSKVECLEIKIILLGFGFSLQFRRENG